MDNEDYSDAWFRANFPEIGGVTVQSQYKATLADSEVQRRWSYYVDLFMKGERLVQGGKTIRDERLTR